LFFCQESFSLTFAVRCALVKCRFTRKELKMSKKKEIETASEEMTPEEIQAGDSENATEETEKVTEKETEKVTEKETEKEMEKETVSETDNAAADEKEGSFERLNIDAKILHAVKDMGFDSASPIQEQAIPIELEGRDVIGQAQTGTGKTAAFGIPMLMKIDPKIKKLQAVVLCPTRELAIQVSDELHKYAKYMHNVKILPVYGGQDIVKQIRGLKDGTQIIVGTPGRVMDHMRRGTVKFDEVGLIILDEADEMLDMGFIDDMKTILAELPEERQTVMFSATVPKEIAEIAENFQKDPVMVRIAKKELTVPEVTQYYYDVRPTNKTEVLCRLIDLYEPKLSVVFCNTKRKVDEVVDELKGRGYYAEGLHGDLSQAQRDRVMKSFRAGRTEILVATDVMARGIDVEDIEAVFNYDIPQDDEYYVHRIGRTGRAGRKGTAFSLVVGRDVYKLREIQRYCKTKILPQAIPSLNDITEIRAGKYLEHAVELIEDEDTDLEKMRSMIDKCIFENDVNSMDLAAALLKIQMGNEENVEDDIIDSRVPRSLDDLGDRKSGGRDGRGRSSRDAAGRGDRSSRGESTGRGRRSEGHEDDDMERLFINIGRNQHVRPSDILGAIAGESGISGRMVGSIDLFDSYSFVDVDRNSAEKVIDAMQDVKIRGMNVHMEKTAGKTEGKDGADITERSDGAEKSDRAERSDRTEKSDRAERYDRAEKSDRAERYDRAEKSDRAER
jgi:ATP-dependent RNA helicase DeaD